MSEHANIDSRKIYYYVFAALIVLTVVTTGIAFIDLGPFNSIVAMTIAVGKMLLVALFFMHMRQGTSLVKVVTGSGLLWLAILMVLTMSDFATRGWLPVPAK